VWPAATCGRGLLDPDAAFIQKPFGPEVIVRIVRERLEGASLPPTAPPRSSAAALDPQEPA